MYVLFTRVKNALNYKSMSLVVVFVEWVLKFILSIDMQLSLNEFTWANINTGMENSTGLKGSYHLIQLLLQLL